MPQFDHHIRLASFDWLRQQSIIHDEVLPRNVLDKGFLFNGERITLIGPKGIWNPRQMQLPLSITTISEGPYADSFTNDNFLRNYRGSISPKYAGGQDSLNGWRRFNRNSQIGILSCRNPRQGPRNW
jgi:hypothetical protein